MQIILQIISSVEIWQSNYMYYSKDSVFKKSVKILLYIMT